MHSPLFSSGGQPAKGWGWSHQLSQRTSEGHPDGPRLSVYGHIFQLTIYTFFFSSPTSPKTAFGYLPTADSLFRMEESPPLFISAPSRPFQRLPSLPRLRPSDTEINGNTFMECLNLRGHLSSLLTGSPVGQSPVITEPSVKDRIPKGQR